MLVFDVRNYIYIYINIYIDIFTGFLGALQYIGIDIKYKYYGSIYIFYKTVNEYLKRSYSLLEY